MRPTDVRRLRGALLRPQRWRGVPRILATSGEPVALLRRYVDSNVGDYPWTTTVRTPTGRVRLQLTHPHDVRTVNEVFFRGDYGRGTPRVVVDAGANIGVSAAYFLSRRPDCRVHCWEPVAANLAVLRENVAAFGDRVVVHERALAPEAGTAAFRTEDVGRYSGLADWYEHDLDTVTVSVEGGAIGAALAETMATEGGVDLLKVDTEGSERALIAAVPDEVLGRVGEVVFEDGGTVHRVSGSELVRRRRR